MITYPFIVKSYVQQNKSGTFLPLKLNCDVSTTAAEDNSSQLTVAVIFLTQYKLLDSTHAKKSFLLGKHVQVNISIGLPTFCT